tara:strand:+ start:449 stop:1360 length:912 start_codon:yes stop_codon:yes gene_type:complete
MILFKKINKVIFILILGTQVFSKSKYNIENIYTIEQDSTYTLKIEFDGNKVENQIFEEEDPFTIEIINSNSSSEINSFVRRTLQPPLMRYTLRESLSGKRKKNTHIKLHFFEKPEYQYDEEIIKGKLVVKLTWNKRFKESKKKNKLSPRGLSNSKISLNFKNAELSNVMRMLSSQDSLNLVLGEDLKGKVTLSLKNVLLETALDAILYVNGYEWFLQGNIIIIKPAPSNSILTGEVTTKIYRLNITNHKIVNMALEDIISDRGKIKTLSSRKENNIKSHDLIMISDVPSKFLLIDEIIATLER